MSAFAQIVLDGVRASLDRDPFAQRIHVPVLQRDITRAYARKLERDLTARLRAGGAA